VNARWQVVESLSERDIPGLLALEEQVADKLFLEGEHKVVAALLTHFKNTLNFNFRLLEAF